MNRGTKRLLGGILFGVLLFFAFLGMKSMFDKPQSTPVPLPTAQPTTPEPPPQPEPTAEKQQAEKPQPAAEDKAEAAKPETPSPELQMVDKFGGLQLTLGDPANPDHPPKGHFVISDQQGKEVASMINTDAASFDLKPGIYEVTTIVQGGKTARMVEIIAGEYTTEHFSLPDTLQAATESSAPEQPQEPQAVSAGNLNVLVTAAASNAPLKANIYIQLPNGKLIDKRNYVDSATFPLQPGSYKVTVKTKGKRDLVKQIVLEQGQGVQEIFAMQAPDAPLVQQPEPSRQGTLSLVLHSQQELKGKYRPRFLISDARGKRIARVTGNSAEVKLEPGAYEILAVIGSTRRKQLTQIQPGKTSKVEFRASDFGNIAQNNKPPVKIELSRQQGLLQLIAVSGVNNQPVKVNFTVSTLSGRILKAADYVSIMEISAPPQDVLVDIFFEGVKGRERVTILPGQPTVFTFTITPTGGQQGFKQAKKPPKRLEDVLLERLQQEIQKRLNQ